MPEYDWDRSFAVISGPQVRAALDGQEKQVGEIIADTYRLHGVGVTVNPPSFFLRFPDRPNARIIALPASVGGGQPVDGLKWISSYPANVAAGLPRASAVLVLNDPATGFPFTCMESSIISATRTASSAALAADVLTRERSRPSRLGFVGAGLIARYVHQHLVATGWEFEEIGIHDLDPAATSALRNAIDTDTAADLVVHESAESLIRGSDLVVFATVAARPHVTDPDWFAHAPLVLHLSLRDLAPEVILASTNVLDDVDHCLKAETSPHLTEQLVGDRSFVHATLPQLLDSPEPLPTDRTIVFSPFGLGVLDLALGKYVYDTVRQDGAAIILEDFFGETDRYGGRADVRH